jgi:hypothetical protein
MLAACDGEIRLVILPIRNQGSLGRDVGKRKRRARREYLR